MIQVNEEQLQERTRAIISVLNQAIDLVRDIRYSIKLILHIRFVLHVRLGYIRLWIRTMDIHLGEIEEFMHTIREEARAIEAEINSSLSEESKL